MGAFNAPQVSSGATIDELREIVARLIKEVQFLADGNISSTNAREFGGWRVGLKRLESKDKDVGMSTDDEGLDPIRFWAGDVVTGTPAFYVTQSGKLFAANGEFVGKITAKSGTIGGFTIDQTKLSGAGIIEGGTIRTGPAGTQRIELTGGVLRGLHSSDKLHGLVFSPSSASNFFDLFLYHDGVKLLEFIDNSNNVAIKPATSIGMYLGGPAGPMNAIGTWDFTGCAGVTGTIPGNCSSSDYAASSGTATAVPSTGITPGTYTKATFAADGRATAGGSLIESDIPSLDFASKISGKPSTLSGYGITDGAAKQLEAWKNVTLANGWLAFGAPYNTPGFYKDNFGIVHLRGLIKSGTITDGTTIFTLPAGYIPSNEYMLASICSSGTGVAACRIDVATSGAVVVYGIVSNNFVSLDNISFRV